MIEKIIKSYEERSTYLKMRMWLAIVLFMFYAILTNMMITVSLAVFDELGFAIRSCIPLTLFFLIEIWALGNLLRIMRITSRSFDFRYKIGKYKTTYLPDNYDFSEEDS